MTTHTHNCAWCQSPFTTGNVNLPPPGWEWLGSQLVCNDCKPEQQWPAAVLVKPAKPAKLAHIASQAGVDRSGLNLPTRLREGLGVGAVGIAKQKPSTLSMLRSGTMIDLADPDYAQVHIRDIASGLAKECRFAGQIDGWWSVAAHCVVGSQIAGDDIAYDFLMHDAAEAIIGDVVTPLKCLLPDYRRIEAMHEDRLFKAFDVKMANKPAVKRIDLIMLAAENIAIRGYLLEMVIGPFTIAEADLIADAVEIIERGDFAANGWEYAFLDRFYDLAPISQLQRFNPKKEMAA